MAMLASVGSPKVMLMRGSPLSPTSLRLIRSPRALAPYEKGKNAPTRGHAIVAHEKEALVAPSMALQLIYELAYSVVPTAA